MLVFTVALSLRRRDALSAERQGYSRVANDGIHFPRAKYIRRTSAAIGHFQATRIRIRRRATGLLPVSLFATFHLGCQLRQLRQRLFNPLRPLHGRTFLRRFRTTICCARILINLVPQRRQLGLRVAQMIFQLRLSTKRRTPCRSPHTHPVLSHARQRHQTLVHQRRQHLSHQLLQPFRMILAEVRQQVVIHAHLAADPFVGQARTTTTALLRQLASAPLAIDGRQQPQRQRNRRIDRIASHTTFHRFDLRVILGQIQFLHKLPNQASHMTAGQQFIQRPHLDPHLIANRSLITWNSLRRSGLGGRVVHENCCSASRPPWQSLRPHNF